MNDFFKEKNGQSSSTRLIFFIGSIWAMGMTTYLAINGTVVSSLIAFFSAIMGVFVGLKLGQKGIEEKK